MRLLFVLLIASPCAVIGTRAAFAFSQNDWRNKRTTTSIVSTKMLLNPVMANLVAGSVAGAIGCGLAHPLDTLKTKAQIATTKDAPPARSYHETQIAQYKSYSTMSPNGLLSIKVPLVADDDGAVFDLSSSFAIAPRDASIKPSMWEVATRLYEQEGLEGFLGGVQTMMIGQALIRAVCFTTNAAVIDYLNRFGSMDPSTIMMIAAFAAGVTCSFVVTPVERIKVVMQSNRDKYEDELHCIHAVLANDGVGGWMTRGLGISLLREVPSVGLSFILYASMMQMGLTTMLGSMAPLLFGAISGSVSCAPVYPLDCIKTRIQNTEGGNDSKSPLEIAQDLYDSRGIGGFVDGITPKMLRCAVLYAVSFSVYETVLEILYSTGASY